MNFAPEVSFPMTPQPNAARLHLGMAPHSPV